MACLHFSMSKTSLNAPVPPLLGDQLTGGSDKKVCPNETSSPRTRPGICCPNIIFSEIPVNGSFSAPDAACIRISTVSSKEHLINAPTSFTGLQLLPGFKTVPNNKKWGT